MIPLNPLHISEDGTQITGYCFTPQDGNSLLSSVAATVWGLYPETYDKIVRHRIGPKPPYREPGWDEDEWTDNRCGAASSDVPF